MDPNACGPGAKTAACTVGRTPESARRNGGCDGGRLCQKYPMSASESDLPDDVGVLKAMIIAGLEREARMQHLLDQLKRATFGRRSEKLSADQLALALEDIEVAQAELLALAEQSPVGPKAEKKRRETTERASLPAHLPGSAK
jgi:hypothetical protein